MPRLTMNVLFMTVKNCIKLAKEQRASTYQMDFLGLGLAVRGYGELSELPEGKGGVEERLELWRGLSPSIPPNRGHSSCIMRFVTDAPPHFLAAHVACFFFSFRNSYLFLLRLCLRGRAAFALISYRADIPCTSHSQEGVALNLRGRRVVIASCAQLYFKMYIQQR